MQAGALERRLAGAPISWGVCEVPGWGHQLDVERVLGEMRELGPDAAAYHREIGEYARTRGVERIIGVGELAEAYEPDERVPDAEAAADSLAAALGPGDAVLVKGSRAAGLETVAGTLAAT